MRMIKYAFVAVFLLVALISGPSSSIAQLAPLQYAVKFVCGRSPGTVVGPGIYFTAINVHNPASTAVGFTKKFAIALPLERPGPVSRLFEARLGPDQALEIDCQDIRNHTQPTPAAPTPAFLKGFAVIRTTTELDVVAVYTATGATGQVQVFDIERVPPRRQ